MNKSLFIFLTFILLGFSYQLECSSLGTQDCENHKTDYKLRCQKFSSRASCVEVEVDDYCKIYSLGSCQAEENIPDNNICINFGYNNKCKRVTLDENCQVSNSFDCVKKDNTIHPNKKCEFDYYKKNCREVDKECSDYTDNNCGSLGIQNGIQCAKLSSLGICEKIIVDNFCEINNNFICAKKEGQNFDEKKYKCDLINKKCQRREITCEEETDVTKCNEFNAQKCFAVGNPSSLVCKSVEVDGKCKIENGECKDGNNIAEYEKCTFNQEKNECKPVKKACEECTTSCSNCQAFQTGYTCSQISENKCKEISIHQSCQITPNDSDGVCTYKTFIPRKTCGYNSDRSICLLIDMHCMYVSYTCDNQMNNERPPNDKTCFLDLNNNECGLKNKECSDLTNSDACVNIESKKCFWHPTIKKCLEYTIDDFCEINGGECKKSSSKESQFGTTEDCKFNYEISNYPTPNKVTCSKKDICTGSWTDCFSKSNSPNSYCISGEDYCKKITPDTDCQVNERELCVHKDTSSNFDQTKGICAYDNEEDKKYCKLRNRKCTEYTNDSCNSLSNCAYYPNDSKCIETDNYCTIIDGNCKKKTNVNEIFHKECGINNLHVCAQKDKACSDIDKTNCNNTPKRTNSQCFHFGEENCREIIIDDYCFINSNGECTNSKPITQYEYCAFDDETKNVCRIKQKKCSDYTDETCGNFTPESKLCFAINGVCQEVKVDNDCRINENNECVTKGSGSCSFDEDKTKCSFKSSSSSGYLSYLKHAILLGLFFIL